jgi:hypothetical protein
VPLCSYQVGDDIAIAKGEHLLKTGVAVERIDSNALGAGNLDGAVSFGSIPFLESLRFFGTPLPRTAVATSTNGSRGVGCPSRSDPILCKVNNRSRGIAPASAQAA